MLIIATSSQVINFLLFFRLNGGLSGKFIFSSQFGVVFTANVTVNLCLFVAEMEAKTKHVYARRNIAMGDDVLNG